MGCADMEGKLCFVHTLSAPSGSDGRMTTHFLDIETANNMPGGLKEILFSKYRALKNVSSQAVLILIV